MGRKPLTDAELFRRVRERREKREKFEQDDPPGHNYLMYCQQVGILKFGKTASKNPLVYVRERYRPKQVWKRIIVIPVEHAMVSENIIRQQCVSMTLELADGREYYYATEDEVEELKIFMQDLAAEQ